MRNFKFKMRSDDGYLEARYFNYITQRLGAFDAATVRKEESITPFVGLIFDNYTAAVQNLSDADISQFAEDTKSFAAKHKDVIIFGDGEDRLARALEDLPDFLRTNDPTEIVFAVLSMGDFLKLRIEELKKAGLSEGLTWSVASERDFWVWINSADPKLPPLIFLSPNGNIGVEWVGKVNEGIALEFYGNKEVVYSLVLCRNGEKYIATCRGNDLQDNIIKLIQGQGLENLIYGKDT